MKKKILSLFIILSLMLCSCSSESIKFDYFNGAFSPFFALHTADMSVNAMVQETLLLIDSEKNEKKLDAYSSGLGIADIVVDDTDQSKLVCTVKVGEKVKFSDGTPMTADDVVFSMYVYADTDYEGWSGFNLSAIDGLKNYRYNNTLAENITLTEEQLDKALANPDEKLQALIKEKIVNPILEDEMDWINRVYNDSAYVGTELGQYIGKYPYAKDLFAFLYSIDKDYDSAKSADYTEVLEIVKAQYGCDYKTLSEVVGINLDSAARRCAEEVITKNMLEAMDGKPVPSIRGIEKLDERTVRVTINTQDDTQFQNVFGIYVAPLHHYGDVGSYDYENSKFGFTRGNLSSIREKNAAPLGAGRYKITEFKNGNTVTFDKNDNYFRSLQRDAKVVFKATGNSAEPNTHEYYVTYENYTHLRD